MSCGYWPGRRSVWFGVGLIGAFLVASEVVSLGYARHLIHHGIANERARGLIHSVDVVVATLTDAETGERGYAITGDDGYLNYVHPTISLGVVVDDCDGTADAYELIEAADEALCSAKRAGRNRVAFGGAAKVRSLDQSLAHDHRADEVSFGP